jgi:hypothetical protein
MLVSCLFFCQRIVPRGDTLFHPLKRSGRMTEDEEG